VGSSDSLSERAAMRDRLDTWCGGAYIVLQVNSLRSEIQINQGKQIMNTLSRPVFACAIALLLIAGAATAQTSQGDMVIMGTASFTSQSGDLHGDGVSTFDLSPRCYYFLRDQIAIGGRLTYRHSSSDNVSSSTLFIGPDGAYFFKTSSESLLPYAGVGLFLSTSSSEFGDVKSDASGFAFALHGGFAYLLRPNLAVVPGLEIDLESSEGNSGTTILLGVGLAGFLY